MIRHDSSGRPWATNKTKQTPSGTKAMTPSGCNIETPSGYNIETPSGTNLETPSGINTSRLTDSSGTTSLTPSDNFFNKLVNNSITNYMANSNINDSRCNVVDTFTGEMGCTRDKTTSKHN